MNNIQCGVGHTCPVQVALLAQLRYDRISAVGLARGRTPRSCLMSQRRITKLSAYDPRRAARESKRANQRAIMHARALANTNTNTNTQADRNN